MIKSESLILAVNASFEKKCLDVLIKSYKTALKKNIFSLDWEEKTFSSHLVGIMDECDLAIKYGLTITKEEELEDEEINSGKKSAKRANPIDIRVHNIWRNQRLKYNIEAKNISNSQWTKPSGSIVSASNQQKEYIVEGIDRFVTGHFKAVKGCMLGYVVKSSVANNIAKVNGKLNKMERHLESIWLHDMKINGTDIYQSTHANRTLLHVFLLFAN